MQLDASIIVTITIFALVHTGGFIWWMSRIDTTLNILAKTVEDISKQIAQHEAIYAKRIDVEKDFALRDQSINAMWKRIDELKDKK